MTFKTYLVGGAVRDGLLGVRTKDYDYSVVVEGATSVEEAYAAMYADLEERGFTIYADYPEFTRIAARFPKGHKYENISADFVLARKEGPYTDHRHPDWVAIGTLEDDLARRDFTVNALAQDVDTGEVIDLFGGQEDLKHRYLRAVGDPRQRIMEDPLRAFRALRFSVVKGFEISLDLQYVIRLESTLDLMDSVSTERIREEVHKMFVADTFKSVKALYHDFPDYGRIMEDRGLWLKTMSGARK